MDSAALRVNAVVLLLLVHCLLMLICENVCLYRDYSLPDTDTSRTEIMYRLNTIKLLSQAYLETL